MMLILMNILFTSGMSFAFWASSISSDGETNTNIISTAQWYDGTPIYTIEEFIEMITTDGNTGTYVLAKDLNFSNITPASWIQTKDIVFKGSFDGNNKTLSNISLTDYRGIFGVLEGATIKNLNLESVNINYTTGDTYTTGILSGRLQGNGNLIDNISINNSSISNPSVISGGLIGFASPLTGTGDATISNIDITNSSISGGYVSASYGNGGIIGTVNNFNINFNEINVSATVTSTSGSNAGGIVGATLGTTTLAMNSISVNNSTIAVNVTGTTLGAGGAVGYLLGTDHTFTDIRITNTAINSLSNAGGIIGYANQTSATATYNNLKVKGSTITASVSSNANGAGGIFGRVLGYTSTLNDVYVEANVTTTNSNGGGIIGYAETGSNTTINRAVIYGDITQTTPASTDRGSAGIIGRNAGSVTANHTLYTGYLKAQAASNRPYVDILRAIGTNVTFTNSRSAEVTYYRSASDPNRLVNSTTYYNNMRGQGAGYTTHTVLRSSLNTTYWTSTFSTITGSALWQYNATTYLYELID